VSGELLIAIAFTILAIMLKSTLALSYLVNGVALSSLVYSIWFYYPYFSAFGYSKVGLFARSLLTSVTLLFVVSSVAAFIAGVKAGIEG
jgi:hypothetical protein